MEKLNEYLQTLLSTCSYELHLEPNRNPYLVTASGATDIANTPMLGTQISMMVFPLIPPDVKRELPDKPIVQFVHPHNLGKFSFTVKKSPAGFNVTVTPMLSDVPQSPNLPAVSAKIDDAAGNDSLSASPKSLYNAPAPLFSPPSEAQQIAFENAANAYENSFISMNEIEPEEPPYIAAPVREFGQPEIEIVSVNDPQFTTVFSDNSTYEPPGRRDDFGAFEMKTGGTMYDEFAGAPKTELPAAGFSEIEPDVFSGTAPVAQKQTVPVYDQQPDVVSYEMPETPSRASKTESSPVKARMDALFYKMSEAGASDLHMSVSMPPMMRKDGKMMQLECDEGTLSPEQMRELLTSIMPEKNREEFTRRSDSDFAYEIPGLARFRANIFADRKGMGGVFRIIPTKILTAEQLGLSKAIMDLCSLSKGLVVVTGPTGSGKSTTLCAMVDSINKNREDHIITIEDPIEFTHENQKCLVNQREVHNHTDSFKDALRAALREDPDILLVGEMRDLETISIAIETAETGHLVFGTLHTTTAASTVDRIIDQFPADRQQQIRVMLSESLKGVIAQTLLPKIGGGRVAALEILIVTPAISNLIREGKTFQIASAMQTGKTHGMVMLNDALFELVKKGLVTPRDAYIKAVDKTTFEAMVTRGGFKL